MEESVLRWVLLPNPERSDSLTGFLGGNHANKEFAGDGRLWGVLVNHFLADDSIRGQVDVRTNTT